MLVCPACDTQTPEGSATCPKCGLSTELFAPIRQAVGLPRSDPHYLRSVQDILQAIGALPTEPGAEPGPAELANASRFLAPAAPAQEGALAGTAPRVRPSSELPMLPAASGVPAIRQQVAEFIELARRRGLDLSAFEERTRALAVVDEETELGHLARDLFVELAASLTDELERLSARQRELASLVSVASLETDLEAGRSSLAAGDLAGAHLKLRRAAEAVDALSDEWGTVEVLVAEGELLKGVIGELGGDPSPATAEFDEGRRLARNREVGRAEEAVTRANLDLWAILKPLLEADLARRMQEIHHLRAAGVSLSGVIADLKEFGVQLRARNFPAAIDLYRRAGLSLEEARRHPRTLEGDSAQAVKTDSTLPPP